MSIDTKNLPLPFRKKHEKTLRFYDSKSVSIPSCNVAMQHLCRLMWMPRHWNIHHHLHECKHHCRQQNIGKPFGHQPIGAYLLRKRKRESVETKMCSQRKSLQQLCLSPYSRLPFRFSSEPESNRLLFSNRLGSVSRHVYYFSIWKDRFDCLFRSSGLESAFSFQPPDQAQQTAIKTKDHKWYEYMLREKSLPFCDLQQHLCA